MSELNNSLIDIAVTATIYLHCNGLVSTITLTMTETKGKQNKKDKAILVPFMQGYKLIKAKQIS